jgi:putative CocE/NonD family hydrolase
MSRQTFELARVECETVPMRDGVPLAIDVYRASSARVPTILLRTPYDCRDLRMRVTEIDPLLAIRRGFAVVIQDLRGRFGSAGEFEAAVPDADDGADTVGWIRRQPWSDGRVMMVGGSYSGCVQFQAARAKPEGLVAIAPSVSGALRPIWYPGGALRLAAIEGWMCSLVVDALAGDLEMGARKELEALLEATPLERFHAFIERDTAAWRIVAPLHNWVFTSPTDRYWTETTTIPPHPLPAIHTTGYYDLCLDAAIDAYAAWHAASDSRAPQALTLGPWDHGLNAVYPDLGLDHVRSPAGMVAMKRQLAFFDAMLGRGSLEDLPPVMSFVLGRNRWHEDAQWPPADVKGLDLALALDAEGGGRLAISGSGERRHVGYRYDPRDPVPTLGGAHGVWGLTGPLEQTPIESRADVLKFTSARFDGEIEIAGAAVARLAVSSSAPATDFLARLTLVRADGRSLPLAHGVWSGRLVDLPPTLGAKTYRRCDIRLGSIHIVLAPGERLRLQVTSSCYPDIYPNPNTGHDLAEGPPRHVQTAEQSLLTGGVRGSSLRLPVRGAPPRELAA